MKRSLLLLSAQILFLTAISCTDDDNSSTVDNPVTHTFTTSLMPDSGSTSKASGAATLLLDEKTKVFQLTVTFSGLVVNAVHILTSEGTILFELSSKSSFSPPTYYTSTPLSSSQIMELMANHYCIKLMTTAFPNGEIGGMLTYTGTSEGGNGKPFYYE